jgi:hypothetical protein
MRIYIVGNDGITLCRETPAAVNEGEIAVASVAELRAAPLSAKRLLALWNALPGVEKRKKVGDRDALIDQLWSAIEMLPDPEPQPDLNRPSKQDVVIATEESVSGVTGATAPGQSGGPPMPTYIIGNDGITLCREPPATVNKGEIAVASSEELHAARLSSKRLLALWNALPGVEKQTKVGDRDTLIDQLWSAIEALPDPDRQSETKRSSKQDAVIAMLQRPQGATVDEVASVMGWQRHTVRGLFSGTLKKKLGLTLASATEERGRVYHIAAPEQA